MHRGGCDLEEGTSKRQGLEMAEADVRGGSMAAEGVEVTPADQNHLRHSESGGAAGERPDVVPLRYVVNDDVALILLRLPLHLLVLHTAAAAAKCGGSGGGGCKGER